MSPPDFARLSQATLKAIQLLDGDEGGHVATSHDTLGEPWENEHVRLVWREDGLNVTLLTEEEDEAEEIHLGEGDLSGIRLSRSVQREARSWLDKLLGRSARKHDVLHVELKSTQRMNLTLSAEVDDPVALEGLPRHVGMGLPISLEALRRVVAHARRLGATYRSWRSQVSIPHLKLPQSPSLINLTAVSPEVPETDEERAAQLEKTLQREPLNSRARRDLAKLYGKLGRHTDRVRLLQEEAMGTSSNTRRLALFETIVDIYTHDLGDAERALGAQRDILVLAPTHQPSLDAVIDDLRHKQHWSELHAQLGHKLETLTGLARIPVLVERARLSADELDAPDEALHMLQRVLKMDASHEEARALFTRLLSAR